MHTGPVRRRGWTSIAVFGATAVAIAIIAATFYGSHRGTVRGRLVFVGGISTTERLLPGVVTFRSRNGDIQTVTTRDGSFSIDLPTGHYKVAGRSPQFQSDAALCGDGKEVDVRADRTSVVTVRCHGR